MLYWCFCWMLLAILHQYKYHYDKICPVWILLLPNSVEQPVQLRFLCRYIIHPFNTSQLVCQVLHFVGLCFSLLIKDSIRIPRGYLNGKSYYCQNASDVNLTTIIIWHESLRNDNNNNKTNGNKGMGIFYGIYCVYRCIHLVLLTHKPLGDCMKIIQVIVERILI